MAWPHPHRAGMPVSRLRRAYERAGIPFTIERQERTEHVARLRAADALAASQRPAPAPRPAPAWAPRETGLRTTAGIRGNPPAVMSAWCGKPGEHGRARRYAVTICGPADEAAILAGAVHSPVVALAVGRGPDGAAKILNASVLFGRGAVLPVRPDGAELHVHRLAASEAAARAVLDDLRPIEAAAA